jgi:hypothetical protein
VRGAYVLLETVIATGLLILGLAVIGAQFQDSISTVHEVEERTKAIMLAEKILAEMSLGLVEFDSLDDIQEEEIGPRYPSHGMRMVLDETATPGIAHLEIQILHYPRETDDEDFDYDEARVLFTTRTLRIVPRKENLQERFGIPDDEYEELQTKLQETGIEGLDPENFDFSILGGDKIPFEDLVEVLPLLMDAFGMDTSAFVNQLPPEYRDIINELMPSEEDGPKELIGNGEGEGN